MKDFVSTAKTLNPKERQLAAKIFAKSGRFLATFIKAMSGTAASDSEAGRLAALLPSLGRGEWLNRGIFTGNFEDLIVGQQSLIDNIIGDPELRDEIMAAKGWNKVFSDPVLREAYNIVVLEKRAGTSDAELKKAIKKDLDLTDEQIARLF